MFNWLLSVGTDGKPDFVVNNNCATWYNENAGAFWFILCIGIIIGIGITCAYHELFGKNYETKNDKEIEKNEHSESE